ncbi:thioredoxin reductase (NADPH) [Sinobacterium caligoides]|uniref:Ferredoxin--NADP reductase n=1 Tax=Sinobacterium caligoides TaxID=933926 RepID=A0A3N2E0Z9_9GAMM|nr:NAD(P)/FAD-dependent oxidoreductase [Sinobacterium caligoides]ROS05790.1 thioredoxin reductase (NADPH) [Sinobacterium caligoides]
MTQQLSPAIIETEALIIGAGPVGLFQVFELGLLGIKAHVVESLAQPGGQCAELYPNKPIFDIPACPAISGQQLTDNLLQQIEPFKPVFHFSQEVVDLQRQQDGRFLVTTSSEQQFLAAAVIIAAGMGSFQAVKLKVDGAEALEGRQLSYSVRDPERYRGKDIVILGGGDSALDWALTLQPIANSVVVIHRSQKFRAAKASVDKMLKLCDDFEMQFLQGQVSELVEQDGKLTHLKVTGSDGVTRRLELDDLLVFFGLVPDLGPLQSWGLTLHKRQVEVDTEKFQTSIPGIYAVGDINYYPGKKKLILSGFHETALAAFAIKEQLEPGKKVHLQYTTTSPIMHKRLHVEDPMKEDAA